jgi:hypothetical protein
MNENLKWGAAAVAVVGLSIGAVVYRDAWWRDGAKPSEPPVVAELPPPAEAVPPVDGEPAVKHPLPAPAKPEPLPSLNESDAPFQNALAALVGKELVEKFVITDNLVRHVVVTIDNLPNEKVAERLRPVKSIPGYLVVSGSEDAPELHPTNFDRYKPMVELIRTTDTKLLVATYARYYPLFQEAYENLGHPPEYFNDRLIEVIDHLLATPDIPAPIALARPSVMYEFADPELESRSAGQKLLIRMGTDNAKAIKDKLKELRSELVAQQPGN